MQPIPVKETYEVVITFVEPLKKDQTGIMDFFGTWDDEDLSVIKTIIEERNSFSLGDSFTADEIEEIRLAMNAGESEYIDFEL